MIITSVIIENKILQNPQAEWMVETLAEMDRCEDGEINGEAQTKKGRCRWLSAQWQQGEREIDSFTTQEET